MMATGIPVFDTTIQESELWLKEVAEHLPPCTRHQAYEALRAALHALRDRLPMNGALGLSAQLPMLLRGVYLEGWQPGDGPSGERSVQDFSASVDRRLPRGFPRAPNEVASAVFGVIAGHVDAGEARKIAQQLPEPVRALWPQTLQ
jgi:uncharacterized protein (DUF2267 family)